MEIFSNKATFEYLKARAYTCGGQMRLVSCNLLSVWRHRSREENAFRSKKRCREEVRGDERRLARGTRRSLSTADTVTHGGLGGGASASARPAQTGAGSLEPGGYKKHRNPWPQIASIWSTRSPVCQPNVAWELMSRTHLDPGWSRSDSFLVTMWMFFSPRDAGVAMGSESFGLGFLLVSTDQVCYVIDLNKWCVTSGLTLNVF